MDLKAFLKDCDHKLASEAIVNQFAGGVLKKELAALLDAYVSEPCLKTAIKVLEYAPDFVVFFEESKPDGLFTRINQKAIDTVDVFIQSILEADIIEGILDTYEQCCRESKFELVPKTLNNDDLKRLLFEVLCFGIFVIIQKSSEYLIPSQDHIVRFFNNRLLSRLEEYSNSLGFGSLQEVIVTAIVPDIQFGLGEPLSVSRRIAEYSRTRLSSKEEDTLELFSRHLAHALDPEKYVITKLIGAIFAVNIVKLIQLVLDFVFKGNCET